MAVALLTCEELLIDEGAVGVEIDPLIRLGRVVS